MRLGRYPFAAGIKYYMEKKAGVWDEETTIPTRKRDLQHIADTLEELKAQGKVATTDPRHMKETDIKAYASAIKRLQPDTQGLRISLLNGYLKFFRNWKLDEMIEAGDILIPSACPKPVRYIELDDLGAVFQAVDGMTGWVGSVARGMVSLYFGTGLRPSELRLAEFEDLDLKRGRIFVRHPKGEGNWATQVWVDIIREDMLPLIKRYVVERNSYLLANGAKSAALFPNLKSGSGYYSENRFRVIKDKIAEESGVEFRLKDFRSTLCTLTINGDLSRLPAMGVQLRHASPETTKKYYANIDRSVAGKQLRGAWKETAVVRPLETTALKPPLIEKRFEVTGYN